jgi:hypothetical protein
MARVGAAIAEVIRSVWSACAKLADGCSSCADAAVKKKTLLAIKQRAALEQQAARKRQAARKAS